MSPSWLYLASGLPTLYVLLWISEPKRRPFEFLSVGALSFFRSRNARLYFISLLSVLLADVALTAIDSIFSNWVGHDFAAVIFKIEGHFVAEFQRLFSSPAVTQFFAWVYITVYPLLVLSSVLIYHFYDDIPRLKHLASAFYLNYLLALPFYLFFPVTEVGFVPASNAIPRLDEVIPGFTHDYRALSGIDNCFPSLHTSMAVTAWMVAWSREEGNLRWVLATFSSLVMISTVYLGIHWAVDVVAGVLFAWLCVWLGKIWSEKTQWPRFR